MTTTAAQALAEFSTYIDGTYPNHLCNEARDRRRIDKITEENGEVSEAYAGMVGENPRKGVTNGLDKVLHELLDVATSALGAYEHFTGNQGTALNALDGHIHTATTRAMQPAETTPAAAPPEPAVAPVPDQPTIETLTDLLAQHGWYEATNQCICGDRPGDMTVHIAAVILSYDPATLG